jgi:hypothetical protein
VFVLYKHRRKAVEVLGGEWDKHIILMRPAHTNVYTVFKISGVEKLCKFTANRR